MGQPKMTPKQALGILAYDISDLISRNDNYDGLIPDDRLTQDELEKHLPAFFRSLGFDPFAAKSATAAKTEFTEHTCNNGRGPFYGRKTPGCPRCDELIAGAPPREAPARVRNAHRDNGGYPTTAEINAHDCRASRCGPVCTFGQW